MISQWLAPTKAGFAQSSAPTWSSLITLREGHHGGCFGVCVVVPTVVRDVQTPDGGGLRDVLLYDLGSCWAQLKNRNGMMLALAVEFTLKPLHYRGGWGALCTSQLLRSNSRPKRQVLVARPCSSNLTAKQTQQWAAAAPRLHFMSINFEKSLWLSKDVNLDKLMWPLTLIPITDKIQKNNGLYCMSSVDRSTNMSGWEHIQQLRKHFGFKLPDVVNISRLCKIQVRKNFRITWALKQYRCSEVCKVQVGLEETHLRACAGSLVADRPTYFSSQLWLKNCRMLLVTSRTFLQTQSWKIPDPVCLINHVYNFFLSLFSAHEAWTATSPLSGRLIKKEKLLISTP